jgi:mannose-6-phosphate isomerase-like protein (cupin superfamily)
VSVTLPGQGSQFTYGAQAMHVLAELPGFSACEVVIPPRFSGPVPHVHHGFDEGLYIIEGELLLTYGHEAPTTAGAGAFCLAPRGVRHTFANPGDTPVRVLGLWSPGPAGLAFMADVGAAMPSAGPPDPAEMAAVYGRHDSELLP